VWLGSGKLARFSRLTQSAVYGRARQRGWTERRRPGDFLIQWWVTRDELEWFIDRMQAPRFWPFVDPPHQEIAPEHLRPMTVGLAVLLDHCREQGERYHWARCARKVRY
jgi:hypothetical protein